ncbi:putative FtsK/SpoIIIE family protein [Actinacidiphila reveromycinica]|uniref:Putative FtsK/SpoIIIE family protein n=1 Tax=Actinacidiphila reveromycinica TaxID=659352 RepID=A0A7U3VMU2_9ACTN|nr:type VII secretion protein EccCa [Streptomyces sp. SN-593]BBA96939.1 putative FtsK/SpoIIIE family protein [Streptomyces sp. SN-593]
MSRIVFHRPARVLPPQLPMEPVVLAAPPQPVGRDANNWLMLLMPLMTSLSMAAYLMAGGRKMLILLGICFVVVSVGTTVGIRMQLRRTARRDKLRARDRYLAHLVEVRRAARQVAESQRVVAAWAYPSPYRLWAIATRRRRVWERRATDADFLVVCVGVGTAPLATPIRMATRNDPTVEYDARAKAAADRLVESASTVGSQPATVDLSRGGVVSVLGPSDVARGVARAVVCQVAVLHAPDDVGLAVVGDATSWGWAKWLPHAHEPDASGEAGVVPLVTEEFDGVADHLRIWLDRFAEQPAVRRGIMDRDAPDTRRRLVVVLDGYDPRAGWARSQTVAELLAAAGPQSGITVLCVVDRERDEPSRADVRVRVDGEGALSLDVRPVERGAPSRPEVSDVLAEWPEVALCEAIARELSPLRLSVEGKEVLNQVTSLPRMLGIGDIDEFDPRSLWVGEGDEGVLRMPLGFDADGQPLLLDLKEAAQGGMGPHGLVVGATGSGKSELLRTLVTGLAATHSPELLSFVLVDFKGGATFAGLADLPHAAGMITNLVDDLALVERVRDALVGEQQRRQRILRDAGNVDNIRDYQMHRAAGRTGPDGSPLPPLPYLLVIVDEFGELLSSRPDFIELFVQIGRVGRSLGMHLLLATQRLEEGRLRGLDANLSYRICLRTFSAAESRVVIGTPDAYRLPPVPGSAYLKVTDAVYERFRVAHVSGPHRSAGKAFGSPEAAPPALFGLRVPPGPGAGSARHEEPEIVQPVVGGPTEMQVIVERLQTVGQTVHQVWLPPLPLALPLDDLTGPGAVRPGVGLAGEWWPERGRLSFPVGVSDIPSQQLQEPLVTDFARTGNLMVIGAPQSGKSTLLRSLMLSAMLTHTPDEAQFTCLDFGGGSLLPFAQAPHVSGVAGRHDLAQARRILAEVRQVIAERELQFRGMDIDSPAEFRRRRDARGLPPRMRTADLFLVIDNWAATRNELEDVEAEVLDIANRGLGVCVHLVVTANRWGDVRTTLRDAVPGRLELRLNDPGESEVDRRAARSFGAVPPGRGLAPPATQFQVALPRLDGRADIEELADAQAKALAKLTAGWEGAVAPAVRMLPERLTVSELDLPAKEPAGVPVGIAEHDLRPIYLDLTSANPHFLVFGDSGSGKTEFLRTWISGAMVRRTPYEARFVLFDFRRGLLGLVPPEYLGAYAGDAGTAASFAQAVADKLAERLPPPDVTVQQLRDRSWWQGPELYVVVDDFDLVSAGRQSPLAPLLDYLPQARELGFHMIIARRVGGTTRRQISEPVLSRLQELGTDGLVMSGDPREGPILGDQRAQPLPPGRGRLIRRSAPKALLQLALTPESPEHSTGAGQAPVVAAAWE